MKMYEEIKNYNKSYVYEQYQRIVEEPKDYEKITRVKMLEAIFEIYKNPDNIIDICTTRELKCLKRVMDNPLALVNINQYDKLSSKYWNEQYEWERKTLQNKFLLDCNFNGESYIPDEIIDFVQKALKKVKWNTQKKMDELNELLVSYCKIQGVALLNVVCEFASGITGLNPEVVWNHTLDSKLFNYYVFITMKKIEGFESKMPIAIFQDDYWIADEIEKQRKLQGIAGNQLIDIRTYKNIFYYDFDINNPKIKKFLIEIKRLPFFRDTALERIREYAMLNIDRKPLKDMIRNVPILRYFDLIKFFNVLDEAMDEMPSGALNGYTPNQAKEIKMKNEKLQMDKEIRYVKQRNACLSKKDAELFYKIYFGLLEYTNQKYKIKEHFKIYNHIHIDPSKMNDIIDKFWEEKEQLVLEFCKINPYRFSQEELELADAFKKGIRNIFVIARYELEDTAFIGEDRIYMVKGIHDNIDEIISYKQLPYVVMTSIIPFKGNLIYDGIIQGTNIKMGNEFDEMVEREYDGLMKYYHL